MSIRDMFERVSRAWHEIVRTPPSGPMESPGTGGKNEMAGARGMAGGEKRPAPRPRVRPVAAPAPTPPPTPAVPSGPPGESPLPEVNGRARWKVREVQQLFNQIDLLLRFQGFMQLPPGSLKPEPPAGSPFGEPVEGRLPEAAPKMTPEAPTGGAYEVQGPLLYVAPQAEDDLPQRFHEITGSSPAGKHLVIVLSTRLTPEKVIEVGKNIARVSTQPLLVGDRGALHYVAQHLEDIMRDCDQMTFCVDPNDLDDTREVGLYTIQNVLAQAIDRPVNLNLTQRHAFQVKPSQEPVTPEVITEKQERLLGRPQSRSGRSSYNYMLG